MTSAATLRTGPILAIVLASYTMIVLDISIVITALPKVHHALGFSATAPVTSASPRRGAVSGR